MDERLLPENAAGHAAGDGAPPDDHDDDVVELDAEVVPVTEDGEDAVDWRDGDPAPTADPRVVTWQETTKGAWRFVPLDLIEKAPWNYKKEDAGTALKLREGLVQKGQVVSVEVRWLPSGRFEMVNGNHRLDEMRAVKAKGVVAYDHGPVSQVKGMQLSVETNQLQFPTDDRLLGKAMQQVVEQYGRSVLDTLPFTDSGLDDLLKLADEDWRHVEFDALKRRAEDQDQAEDVLGDGGGWVYFEVALPPDAARVWQEAARHVREAEKAAGRPLSKKPAAAAGQVAEMLAAEYLAGLP